MNNFESYESAVMYGEIDSNQEQFITEHELQAEPATACKLRRELITEFTKAEMPERKMLLSPWLPEQGLAMVYAPRGVGKTFFALNVAYAVATGGEYLGWKAESSQSVLYVDGEMVATDMQARIRDILEPDKEVPFYLVTPDRQPEGLSMPNLTQYIGQARLDGCLDGIKLIVIDNIATLCCGVDENDTRGWSLVQEWALRMRKEGIAVLFVHHSGKSGKQRGTSSREDVLDTVVELRQPSDYSPEQGARFTVNFKKHRGFYGEEAKPLEVQLVEQEDGVKKWLVQDSMESLKEQAIELFNAGEKQVRIAEMLKLNKSTISRYIKEAKTEGRIIDQQSSAGQAPDC